MSKKPFESQANYAKFLQVQALFHQAVQAVYTNPILSNIIEQLDGLSRLDKIRQDMQDLQVASFDSQIAVPTFDEHQAIGWFYCVEGSNVGAAILYKEAGKIKLDDGFGARHLAAHPDGRMAFWRATKDKIDSLDLDNAAKAAALQGCDDAFAYFGKLVQEVFADA